MDLLADMMTLLRMEGHTYGCLDLKGPFALSFPTEISHFLIVTRGSCFLDVPGEADLALETGDFIFLPRSTPMILKSSREPMPARAFAPTEAEKYTRTGALTLHGGDGPAVALVCGCFTFSSPESVLLVRHLPAVLVLPATGPHANPWVASLLPLIAGEMHQDRLGARTVLDRLAEVLFIHAVRGFFETTRDDPRPSWIRALNDGPIGQSLQHIHSEPGRPWTVETLAGEVGLSRSAFAARFKTLVGETPLEHVTRWRMARAAGLIRAPRAPKLEAVAAAVGYESESSFRKAFQKVMGTTPAQYRRAPVAT